jgi:hypothetical protein
MDEIRWLLFIYLGYRSSSDNNENTKTKEKTRKHKIIDRFSVSVNSNGLCMLELSESGVTNQQFESSKAWLG